MNITDNLIRIKEGKNNIIKSLKNKGVSISDDALINEIPTIIDNAEIGGGGGDTPSVPTELVPKYDGASVFRIVVPTDNYEFAINLCNDATKATYDVDWGDGSLESGLTTDKQHHTYSKSGTYDVNIYNISKDITLGGRVSIVGVNNLSTEIYYLFNNINNDCWVRKYIYNKDNFVTNILIGDSVTSIGSSAFYGCSSLQSIVISEGVTSIGLNAFAQCRFLQSIVIPNSVTSIGSSVFNNCSSLQSVAIPDSVTSIENSVFEYCTSLQSINIPNSVTSIGNTVFSGCSSLQSINIPNSVTSIGNTVFSGCSSLQSVVIPEGVTSIGSSAFQNCSSLQSVVIPEGVTSIGNSTFSSCTSLQSVVIPEGVISIGSDVFQSCFSLQSINIPNSVTSIGRTAFSGCSSLQSVVISDSVTSIGDYLFNNCSSLQSVVIPERVTSIGSSAFSSCTSLQSINIPNSVTSIGSSVFNNCKSLQSITCNAMTAPTIQSGSFPTSGFLYTKRYLYIHKDADIESYTSGNFKTYLLDKGWELRYIEDKPEKIPTTLKLKTKNNFFHNLQTIGQANLINYELINDEYIYNFDDKIIELIQHTFYNNVLEEIELPEGLEIIGGSAFSNYYYLHSITCKAMIAPTIQSNTFSSVGSKVPSGTPKILRVPEGSDYSTWKSQLSGFTLEYVPLSEL